MIGQRVVWGLALALGLAVVGLSVSSLVEHGFVPGGQTDGVRRVGAESFGVSSWASGWVDIAPGQALTLTHSQGGDPSQYAVDLWFRDTGGVNIGVNHRGYGGLEFNGVRYGAFWSHLTDSTIRVSRNQGDLFADQVYVRVRTSAVPDWDSGWLDIGAGQSLTLTHNLGGVADDYLVGVKFRSTAADGPGVHQFAAGGMETSGRLVGAAWSHLTNSAVTVFRFGQDQWADQVRLQIVLPDLATPPSYDSGWVSVSQGVTQVITHSLGGNPNNYILRYSERSAQAGINVIGVGGLARGNPVRWVGSDWENLTSQNVSVLRRSDDVFAEQVRVRIWRPGPILVPLVYKTYTITTSMAAGEIP